MLTIHKYPLIPIEEFSASEILVNRGSQLLHVGFQDGRIMAWFHVDTDRPCDEKRHFKIYGTGWKMPFRPYDRYVGTVHLTSVKDSTFVFHVYEDEGSLMIERGEGA